MATAGQWVEGARLRTLPAAISPVLAGTGVAAYADRAVVWKAALALVVALALQVGVNYANDYSDGVRGTDADRVGPLRLVGSGAAPPGQVKAAAFAAFGVAAVAGLVLAATTAWWLVVVGALAILAAWYYTGGSRPYGYAGLGEVMVFVFFGLVAVCGTTYVQVAQDAEPSSAILVSNFVTPGRAMLDSLPAAVGVGAIACALLVVNNLRDIPSDREAGKITLAVRLGEQRTRTLYVVLLVVALVAGVVLAALTTWWALLALAGLGVAAEPARSVAGGAIGRDLVPALRQTGLSELVWALGAFVGLLVGR